MIGGMSMVPGWYPDPFSPDGFLRWWDGERWTSHSTTPQALAQAPSAAAAAASAYPLASWGRRFGGFVVDQLLLGVVLAPLVLWLLWPAFVDLWDAMPADGSFPAQSVIADFQSEVTERTVSITVTTLVVSALYYVPQYALWARTVGHRVVGVRLRSREQDSPPTWGASVLRWLMFLGIASVAGALWLVVDGLWPLWDKPYAQALHDKVAGTVVVPRTSGTADAYPGAAGRT